MKKIALVIFFVLTFVATSWALTFFEEVNTGGVGASFSLPSLSGEIVNLSDYKNKPVILFFWTTWCPHCQDAIVQLQRNYEDITASGVALLAIDSREPKERVERFARQRGISFPVLLDQEGNVAVNYRVKGIPTFILLSKEGKIALVSHVFPANYKSILLK